MRSGTVSDPRARAAAPARDVPAGAAALAGSRVADIDAMKGAGIALVVVGHAFVGLLAARLAPADGWMAWAHYTIYLFHMPLFFLLSGLFAARRLFPQRYAAIAAWGAGAYLTKKWAERAAARKAAEDAHAADADIANAGVVDPYAGVSDTPPTDGESMGDALPPPIPLGADGKRPALH